MNGEQAPPDPALVASITANVIAQMQANGQNNTTAPQAQVLAPPVQPAPVEAASTPIKGPFQEDRANAEWQHIARAWAANPDQTWDQLAASCGVWANHESGPVEAFRMWRTNPKVVRDMAYANPRKDSAPNTATVTKAWLNKTVAGIPLSTDGAQVIPTPAVVVAPVAPVALVAPVAPPVGDTTTPAIGMPWEKPDVPSPAENMLHPPGVPAAPTMDVATARICIRHAYAMRMIADDLAGAGVWKKADGTPFKRVNTYGVKNPEYLVNAVRKAGYDPHQIANDLGLLK